MLTKKQIKHLTRAIKTNGVMIKPIGTDAKNKTHYFQVYYIAYNDRGTPFITKLMPYEVNLSHKRDSYSTFLINAKKDTTLYSNSRELFKIIKDSVLKAEMFTPYTFHFDEY